MHPVTFSGFARHLNRSVRLAAARRRSEHRPTVTDVAVAALNGKTL